MALSEYEREVLRRLDFDLDRQDPRFAWQLSGSTELGAHVRPSWRPPRSAVVVALVMVMGVVFMLASFVLLMQPSCRVGNSSAGVNAATIQQEAGARSAAPGRSGSPSLGPC